MAVREAVERDLEEVRSRDAALADSALGATALALADLIDDPENSATSRSMCARELREVLDRIGELAPPKKEMDRVDDLASRRAERRAGARGAATADLPGP